MLAMNETLMRSMDDAHLIAALEAEGPLTPAERELMRRLDILAGQEREEEIAARYEREYKSVLEQSGFRAELIQHIVDDLCEMPGSKKALVEAIRGALEDSYVEL